MVKTSDGKNAGRLPKNEILWERYYNKDGEMLFVMTSDKLAETYTLYSYKDGFFVRLGRGRSPTELEQKNSVNEIILGKLE